MGVYSNMYSHFKYISNMADEIKKEIDLFDREGTQIDREAFLNDITSGMDDFLGADNLDWKGHLKKYAKKGDYASEQDFINQVRNQIGRISDAIRSDKVKYNGLGTNGYGSFILDKNNFDNLAARTALGYINTQLQKQKAYKVPEPEKFDRSTSWKKFLTDNRHDPTAFQDLENQDAKVFELINNYTNGLEDEETKNGLTSLLSNFNESKKIERKNYYDFSKYLGSGWSNYFPTKIIANNESKTEKSEQEIEIDRYKNDQQAVLTEALKYYNDLNTLPENWKWSMAYTDENYTVDETLPEWLTTKEFENFKKTHFDDYWASVATNYENYLKNVDDYTASSFTLPYSKNLINKDLNITYNTSDKLKSLSIGHKYNYFGKNLYNYKSHQTKPIRINVKDTNGNSQSLNAVIITTNKQGRVKLLGQNGGIYTMHISQLPVAIKEELRQQLTQDKYGFLPFQQQQTESNHNGGILKAQYGVTLEQYRNNLQVAREQEKEAKQQAKKEKNEKAKQETGYDTVNEPIEWNAATAARLTSIGLDLGALAASLTGAGAPVSAVTGAAGTTANVTADMMDGMSLGQAVWNNKWSYLMDAASIIPFLGAAKAPKILAKAAKLAPIAIGLIGTTGMIANGGEYIKSWKKLGEGDFSKLSVQDYRNLAESIQLLTTTWATAKGAYNTNRRLNASIDANKRNVEVKVGGESTKKPLDLEIISKLRAETDIAKQNKILQEALGDKNVTLPPEMKGLFRSKETGKGVLKTSDYYDLNKPKLQIHSITGLPLKNPDQFRWGEREVANLQLPSFRIPSLANAYDWTFHHSSYKANKAKPKSEPKNSNLKREENIAKQKQIQEEAQTKRDIKRAQKELENANNRSESVIKARQAARKQRNQQNIDPLSLRQPGRVQQIAQNRALNPDWTTWYMEPEKYFYKEGGKIDIAQIRLKVKQNGI